MSDDYSRLASRLYWSAGRTSGVIMAKRSENQKRGTSGGSHARPSGKARSTRTGDAPGRGHVDSPETPGRTKTKDNLTRAASSATDKVGSSEQAAQHFAGESDFG